MQLDPIVHHVAPSAAPGGGGHGGHHQPGAVFPGQPPAWVLPPAVGPGVLQPPDVPDTAKGSPLPHWDGVLLGSEVETAADGTLQARNLYVNGAFNYLDHVGSLDDAIAAVTTLTAGPDRPAAVLWRDKFGIIHAQALLTYGGIALSGAMPGTRIADAAPVAAHLGAGTVDVNLGHPEALAIIDGDVLIRTSVPDVVAVPDNGAGQG